MEDVQCQTLTVRRCLFFHGVSVTGYCDWFSLQPCTYIHSINFGNVSWILGSARVGRYFFSDPIDSV